ncbi:MAG: SRPBCC domain-containing protein [Candidatus Neomarinimicrobiota bacterium]
MPVDPANGEAPTTGLPPKIGDAAVQESTGRIWGEWFAQLDAAGGQSLSHRELVALVHKQAADASGWWQQMVAVTYEKARGLRVDYQTAGGYQISRSKTVAVPVAQLYEAFANETLRGRWLPQAGITIRKATPEKSLRVTWIDGTTDLDVEFYAKGDRKCQVVVQHRKLSSPAQAEEMKALWGRNLGRLKAHLEG